MSQSVLLILLYLFHTPTDSFKLTLICPNPLGLEVIYLGTELNTAFFKFCSRSGHSRLTQGHLKPTSGKSAFLPQKS